MTNYQIQLQDTMQINDSITTQVDFGIILNEILNFITSLGGIIQ